MFANSQPSASNFKSFSPSLDQFFITVSQNNFDNKIPLIFFSIFFLHWSIHTKKIISIKERKTVLQKGLLLQDWVLRLGAQGALNLTFLCIAVKMMTYKAEPSQSYSYQVSTVQSWFSDIKSQILLKMSLFK